MPPLIEEGLWPAQIIAIRNLEKSLKANKPRALIQMATGSGKTFTSISFIYRLIKFAGARRVLFLVDRGNLGRQTKKEFDQYTSPYNNYKFGEEYIVQHLTSNQLDTTARVTICTIQRLFSMLKGRELAPEDDEQSVDGLGNLFAKPEPIGYNPSFPIETFDIIVTDEAHRSIYNLWRQVLEYFDAYGLDSLRVMWQWYYAHAGQGKCLNASRRHSLHSHVISLHSLFIFREHQIISNKSNISI